MITRGDSLKSFYVFHSINKKYAGLAVDIDRQIKALHEAGALDKLINAN